MTWSSNGTTITITGVALGGGAMPVNVTVPAANGHETTDIAAVFPNLVPPGVGTAQVQVAP